MVPLKKFDLTGLTLDGLIVHEIGKGTPRIDPTVAVELSMSEAPKDPALFDFLNLQLRNGMTEGGYPASISVNPPVGGAKLLIDLIEGPLCSGSLDADVIKVVVDCSKELATTLQSVQEHNSPPGMFAFCRGLLHGGPAVAIMKLESQRGLQLVRSADVLTLRVHKDLFVGNKAKLFKAAVFWLDGEDVRVMVCDEQTGGSASHPAADFFVKDLLGCTISENAQVRTAKFFDAAGKAAKLLANPEDRMHLLDAIRVELGSRRQHVDPVQFIADNFPADKQDAIHAFFKRQGVDITRFGKDSSTIERQFRRTTFRFEHGPSVIAGDDIVKTIPAGQEFDDTHQGLQVRYSGDAATMVIRGTIDEVKHRS